MAEGEGRAKGVGGSPESLSADGTEPACARSSQLAQCAQTCHAPAHMRAKSLEFARVAWASAGHVQARLPPLEAIGPIGLQHTPAS